MEPLPCISSSASSFTPCRWHPARKLQPSLRIRASIRLRRPSLHVSDVLESFMGIAYSDPDIILHLAVLQGGAPVGTWAATMGHDPTCVRCIQEHAATLDRDLRDVLELASDAELQDLANILYGQSLLSPLLKSITRGDGSHKKFDQDMEEREALVDRLESRFLYLGADAKETLRGWRPTYRGVLLGVRAKLNVHCSAKLSTEDLEVEIFLHLLQQNTRGRGDSSLQSPWKHQLAGNGERVNHMDQYSKNWHVALKLGGGEFLKVILKGGGVFSVSFFQRMVARRLGGRVLVEMARYQFAKEVVKKGGRAAALNLQSRVAVIAARQGLAGAASCYAALQRTSLLFGPLLWGTFLAEVVIKSVGTDYARVVKAIYAFAQIRLLRTYGWTQAKQELPA